MGLFASATGATMGVMCVCYSRALRKVAYFSKPWEHVIFGVFGGAFLANKLLQAEEWTEAQTHKLLKAKMERNKGVLDEKYRSLLGSKYDKYFPEA